MILIPAVKMSNLTENLRPPDLQHLTSVYLGLLIVGGQIGLPIIVFTALTFKKVTWHPTVVNFCITWILYSIIYCLYLYSGARASQTDPHRKLCSVQACMIHGAAPMAVIACLTIVLHTWTTVQQLQCVVLNYIPRVVQMLLILGTPYLVFLAFSVHAGTLVLSQPEAVFSNGLYCIIHVEQSEVVVPSFCAAVSAVILAMEVIISIQYYRQWRIIKRAFPLVTRRPSRSLCFRIGLFCLYSCVTLTSAILFLSAQQTEVTYILPAALPLGSLIVFGLQKDVISSWTSALRGRKPSGSSSEIEVPSARPVQRRDSMLNPFGFHDTILRDPAIPDLVVLIGRPPTDNGHDFAHRPSGESEEISPC